MYLMIAACRCNIWPRQRVWPLQSCRELLPMASPWLLSDCAGSGHPIHIGPCLSNRPDQLDSCDMACCQGRVAHHYWAMMTNITDLPGIDAMYRLLGITVSTLTAFQFGADLVYWNNYAWLIVIHEDMSKVSTYLQLSTSSPMAPCPIHQVGKARHDVLTSAKSILGCHWCSASRPHAVD